MKKACRHFRRLASLASILVLMMIAGCQPGLDAQLSSPANVQTQIEEYFFGVQGRFNKEYIDNCLSERRKRGAKFSPIGEAIYQPSYFFTCVANTDAGNQEFIQHKPGQYAIAYEVHVPISKPGAPGDAAVPDGQWFYWTRCHYTVNEGRISYQENARASAFIGEASGGRGLRHICMVMPNAERLLQAVRENAMYLRKDS